MSGSVESIKAPSAKLPFELVFEYSAVFYADHEELADLLELGQPTEKEMSSVWKIADFKLSSPDASVEKALSNQVVSAGVLVPPGGARHAIPTFQVESKDAFAIAALAERLGSKEFRAGETFSALTPMLGTSGSDPHWTKNRNQKLVEEIVGSDKLFRMKWGARSQVHFPATEKKGLSLHTTVQCLGNCSESGAADDGRSCPAFYR